ncbi:MAG: DUF72 domain-containing protein [Cytophagales bacterium]|nr:DUF72 domain-containing protein [Cytophaga sp.]
MNTAIKEFLIGCSGYYYPQWKNTFYPPKMPAPRWLEYYSSIFNTVELNGTFYRIPKLKDLQKYHNVTPDAFRFSVKMNKYITHTVKLHECKAQIEDFKSLMQEGLSNKLRHVLFQFPASFQYSEKSLEVLLENIGTGAENVIEFRHISWWNKEVKEAFTKAHLTFCNVDYPGLKPVFIHTSKDFYLRLHGTPDLFKSSYDTDQLRSYYQAFPDACSSYSTYFNNTYYDAAFKNALALKEIPGFVKAV